MLEKGVTVKIISSELDSYINTSKLFKVVNNKPYKEYNGWVEIANETESIITREKYLEIV